MDVRRVDNGREELFHDARARAKHDAAGALLELNEDLVLIRDLELDESLQVALVRDELPGSGLERAVAEFGERELTKSRGGASASRRRRTTAATTTGAAAGIARAAARTSRRVARDCRGLTWRRLGIGRSWKGNPPCWRAGRAPGPGPAAQAPQKARRLERPLLGRMQNLDDHNVRIRAHIDNDVVRAHHELAGSSHSPPAT